MAVRLWSNRVSWRPARGLVAAWGVVLGLTAISAAIVFGLVREPPRVAPAAEAASPPAPPLPPRAVSLKLPPRPTDFRILPAAEREAMVETTADGLAPAQDLAERLDAVDCLLETLCSRKARRRASGCW